MSTLRADAGDNQQAVAIEYYPKDSRIRISEDGIVQTLTNQMGTGGNNVPLTFDQAPSAIAYGIGSYDSEGMKSGNPHTGFYEAATARTLDQSGGNPACHQGGMAVVAFTQNQRDEVRDLQNRAAALNASPSAKQQTFVYAMTTGAFNSIGKEVATPLMARDYKSPQIVNMPKYVVRRLTPQECAMLQGFPADWCAGLETPNPTEEEIAWWTEVFETHRRVLGKTKRPRSRNQIIKWLADPHTDAAEYKLWGNGVALPCACFVMAGIAAVAASAS